MTEEEKEFFTPGNRYKHKSWSLNIRNFYEVVGGPTIIGGTLQYSIRDEEGYVSHYRPDAFYPLKDWICISRKEKKKSGFKSFMDKHSL